MKISSKLIDNTENYSCRFNEVDKNGSFIGMIALEVNLFQNNAINTPPIPKNVVKSSQEILADSGWNTGAMSQYIST